MKVNHLPPRGCLLCRPLSLPSMPGEDFVVTPWEVRGEVDYEKLVERFGTKRIDAPLLERIRHAAGEVHPMLRRGIFYSHRDLDLILNAHAKKDPWVLYTGRGPSSGIHLGHILPWVFTRWMQERFGATLYFQVTDDEKFLFKDFERLDEATKIGYENILDIIAIGFDPAKTRIFLDTEYIHHLYPVAVQVAKRITFSTAKAVFGFDNANNLGEIFYTAMQSVPCFLASIEQGRPVPALIPCGIDQDPHFRVTRDIAEALGYPKPALVHNKLLPALTGPGSKMSASQPETSIFTTDTAKATRKKVNNAFTGGRASVEEQRRLGANPDVCSVFAYYQYLFEPSDEGLKTVETECRTGARLCGECKEQLLGKILPWMEKHQAAREAARDRVDEFMLRDAPKA